MFETNLVQQDVFTGITVVWFLVCVFIITLGVLAVIAWLTGGK